MRKTPELYDRRNAKKKYIEFSTHKLPTVDVGGFRRYWEGVNLGSEISKDGKFKMPCLILKTNTGNGLVLVAPITTKFHSKLKYQYIPIHNYEKYGLKESRIIKNQIKLVDKRRCAVVFGSGKKNRTFADLVLNEYISFLKK